MNTDESITLPWLDEPRFRCFGCSPHNHIGLALTMRHAGDECIRSDITFSVDHTSYPGIVHGGIVSVVLDEVMGKLLALKRGMLAFSVTLRTRFLRPLLVGHRYTAEARIARDGDGVVLTEATMSSAAGELHVMATGTYQPIRSEQARRYMDVDSVDYDRLRPYFDHQIGQS